MNPYHNNRPNLLRTQVYNYLRKNIDNGHISPGEYVKFNEICDALEISRTPVRDALLHLQAEGFVSLLPQHGIQINHVSQTELRNIYEALGGLEAKMLKSVFHRIGEKQIEKMKKINEEMNSFRSKNEFHRYYKKNLAFHNVFINLSKNDLMKYHISILKQRIFEFTKRVWGRNWQTLNYDEHKTLIDLIEKGDASQASTYWDDVHWSFNW